MANLSSIYKELRASIGQRVDAALLGDAHTVGDGIRQLGEEARHLLRALQIILAAIELHALGGS